jgi:GNAT superfamily N-acetyltransferase
VDEVTIREASVDDAAALSELAHQLGYGRSPEVIRGWILSRDDSRVALVAAGGGEVMGWLEAHEIELLQYPRFLEIGGMVVAEHLRGRGIGRRLVEVLIDWGRARQHTEVRVRSNVVRDASHPFYEGLGFVRQKTSHTYSLDISDKS